MPNLVASLAPAGTFTAGGTGTITAGSLAFGTNADRAVAVLVTSISGDVAAVISSVVVGGVTLTPGANVDISNEYGGAGSKGRIFTGTGIPTGSHAPDINWANPNFVGHHIGYAAMAFDDAATLTVTDAGAGTSGTAPTITLTSASGDLMAAFGAWQPDVRATVTAPSAEQFDGLATAQTGTFYGETQTAASSSTTLAATAASSTGGWRMWGLRVEGAAAAPVITGPSGGPGAGTSAANLVEGATSGPTMSTDIAPGGGYPTITGPDAGLFILTTLSSTSWRVDPNPAKNFEAPADAGANNVYDVVFNASVSVSQALAMTVTNANEAPTFTGSTVGPLSFTAGSPITPVDISALGWTEPDAGDTATYSLVGSWPAGLSVVGVNLQGTPAVGTGTGVAFRRVDAGGLGGNTNTFNVTVTGGSTPVSFAGTVPSQVVTIGSAFSLALAGYFSGSLTPFTYSVLSGSLPAGLSLNTSTGAITGTPTTAGSSSAVIRATDTGTNTAQTGSISFTISASATPVSFSGTVPAQTATEGSSYSLALAPYFSGSETPFTYSVLSGALPTGLSLNSSTGAISGTPSAAGSFSAVVRATDTATNTAQTGSIAFTVNAPGTYTVHVGPFAANTGSMPRAQGEAFSWWAAHNVYIGGDWDAATRLSGSGTLDAEGQAAIDLTAVGFWEVQIRFPDDTDTEAEKGTARQTVTVA